MKHQFEIQIFDSATDILLYADGQCAAIYGQTPPLVNVCRKAGTADMHFEDRAGYRRDIAEILDHQPERQMPLVNDLHPPRILRVRPNRPKMLAVDVHFSRGCGILPRLMACGKTKDRQPADLVTV